MAHEAKELTAPGNNPKGKLAQARAFQGGLSLIPQILVIRQKRFRKNKMRMKAKIIKNILLLFFKQDPEAFKEICKLSWVDGNVVGKGRMPNQSLPSSLPCELMSRCVLLPGFRGKTTLDYQG